MENELTWYRITDGITDHTTNDWSEVIDVVTGWHDYMAEYEAPEGSSEPNPENFPNPVDIYALALSGQDPDLDRLNALIASWEGEIEKKYGISLYLKVTRISRARRPERAAMRPKDELYLKAVARLVDRSKNRVTA